MLIKNNFKSTTVNNLKTNNFKEVRVGFSKHDDENKFKPNTEKVSFINVGLEELTQAIILSDHHNNPVLAKQFNTMLNLQCDTIVKGPKTEKQLKKQVFAFNVSLNTGKNQFEFVFDVRGGEVMLDGSKLYENLKTASTKNGYVFQFDCAKLASILVEDVPSNLAKHYGHTNLDKVIAKFAEKELNA